MEKSVWRSFLALALSVTSVVGDVIERTAHETRTRVIEAIQNEENEISYRTNEFTQFQTGLNYWSPEKKEWLPTSEEIEINPQDGGALYSKGPFQVHFPPDYADKNGIEITLSDGRAIRLQAVGVAISDSESGESFWLGRIKSSRGFLTNPNEIRYVDTFDGIKADINAKIGIGKFEHDITLKEQPIDAANLALLGVKPERAKLEIWHRILSAPQPTVLTGQIIRPDGTVDQDQQLDFEDLLFGEGAAFLVGKEEVELSSSRVNEPSPIRNRIPVAKELFTPEGDSTYLIESVPYLDSLPQLETLPEKSQAAVLPDPVTKVFSSQRSIASLKSRSFPIDAFSPSRMGEQIEREVAAITRMPMGKDEGFLFDYTTVTTASNYRFSGSTTYKVTGNVTLSGTTAIEGGTVVKFSYLTNGGPILTINGPIVCETTPYAPAIFTAEADQSVGGSVGSNTNTGYFSTYLDIPSANTNSTYLHDLRFCYGGTPIYLRDTNVHTLANIQVVNCYAGLYSVGNTTFVRNLLVQNSIEPFIGWTSTIYAEHVTARVGDHLFQVMAGATLYLTNSLVVGMTNSTFPTISDHVTTLSSDSGVFQTIGTAYNYLASGSTNRDAGTPNISPQMASILSASTTYPPIQLSNNFTTNNAIVTPDTTTPIRDSVSSPDLGYHYPALDFVFGGLSIVSNKTVIFTNGVCVGANSNHALILQYGAKLICEGQQQNLNRLVHYKSTMEQPIKWGATGMSSLVQFAGSTSELRARFTEMNGGAAMPGQLFDISTFMSSYSPTTVSFRDCQLINPSFTVDLNYAASLDNSIAYTFTNNYLQRATVGWYQGGSSGALPITLELRNNLFRYGNVYFNYSSVYSPWHVFDNLFENSFLTSGGTTVPANDYNGYLSTTALSGGSHNKSLTSPDYQAGPMGNFYYSISGNLTNLIDAGSMSAANAQLFHYTTMASQAKETNTTVDIGFHYLSVNSAGQSNDDDGDGVPDYVEDSNGNGVWDSGESRWTSDDPDYDGIPTWQEILDGTDPLNSQSVSNRMLGHWKFDTANFLGESYPPQVPLITNGVTTTVSWNGYAGTYSSSGGSKLGYLDVETNLNANINTRNGTIRFWFKPNWSSGAGLGPGAWSDFITVGNYITGDISTFALSLTPDGTKLRLISDSNDHFLENEFPISFSNGKWYQVALTYTPTNIAAYLNGGLVGIGTSQPDDYHGNTLRTVGYGIYQWPDQPHRSLGLGVGNLPPLVAGDIPLKGQIDELETYNYALTPQQIANDFPSFGGATGVAVDTDQDGRTDLLETYVDGTNPNNSLDAIPTRLAYLRFNRSNYMGEQGQLPSSSFGVSQISSWSDKSLYVSNSTSAGITYRAIESKGWANFTPILGSVRFWFKSDWATNSAPSVGSFLYTGAAAGGRWDLRFEGSGNNIRLITGSSSSTLTTNFTYSFAFTPSQWHQLVVTYNTRNSYLYIDGVAVVTNGLPINGNPSAVDCANGLVIGNKTGGGQVLNGYFDELETFTYNLTAGDVATSFATVAAVDTDLNGVADILENINLSANLPFTGIPFAVTGVIEAEQFDKGGYNKGYHNTGTNAVSDYRATDMLITAVTNDIGGGYCLDNLRSNEWVQYTLDVRLARTYWVEPRILWAGTNAALKIEFSTNGGTSFYRSISSFVTSGTWTNNWTNVGTKDVDLIAGTNVMRISMLTNGIQSGIDVGSVAKLNYISIYPSWSEGVTNIAWTNSISAASLSTNSNWLDGRNNALAIQAALDGLGAHLTANQGGVVELPPGKYYISQADGDVTQNAALHTGMRVPRNNIEIRGAGKTNTTLVAFNRATTILVVGEISTSHPISPTNVTIRDLSFEARPHLVGVLDSSNGTYTNYYEHGGYSGPWGLGFGALIAMTGDVDAPKWTRNVLITNCFFHNADRAININQAVGNVLVRASDFVCWDGVGAGYTGQTNTGGTDGPVTLDNTGISPSTEANVFGIHGEGWVIVDNNYQGNPSITSTVTNYGTYAPDGFVWVMTSGNYFVGRNSIKNYSLEAVQFNGGPFAVAQNSFNTYTPVYACCALNSGIAWSGISGRTNEIRDFVGSFIGNNVNGGRQGCQSQQSVYANRVNFCGNTLRLDMPFNLYSDPYGTPVSLGFCETLNMSGNTLTDGYLAAVYYANCTNAVILKNDLSGARNGGILIYDQNDLFSQQIVKNTLNAGVSYHLRAPIKNGTKLFTEKNIYQIGSSSNSIVLDSSGIPIHFVQ